MEIEAKCLLKAKNQIPVLKNEIIKIYGQPEKSTYSFSYVDEYWKPKDLTIRIRTVTDSQGYSYFITTKNKTFKGGIEINQEIEEQIGEDTLTHIIRPLICCDEVFQFSKIKTGTRYTYIINNLTFNIDIGTANKTGKTKEIPYLEIECIADKSEATAAREQILHIFQKLGFKPTDLDPRSWRAILE